MLVDTNHFPKKSYKLLDHHRRPPPPGMCESSRCYTVHDHCLFLPLFWECVWYLTVMITLIVVLWCIMAVRVSPRASLPLDNSCLDNTSAQILCL